MLTLQTLLKAIRQETTYGDRGGTCFGTSDPTRLRSPTTPPRLNEKADEHTASQKKNE